MLTQAQVDRVRELLAKGVSFRQASLATGVSRGSVHNIACRRPKPEQPKKPEPQSLRHAVRCTGCGAMINVTPCVRCMAAKKE